MDLCLLPRSRFFDYSVGRPYEGEAAIAPIPKINNDRITLTQKQTVPDVHPKGT
jgi:hypothetical protein